MEYRALIDQLNAHEIEGFRFRVEGYGHYRNCEIAYIYDEFPTLGKRAVRAIRAKLCRDEECYFYGPFNEGQKIFRLSGKGRKTLYDIWDQVTVLEVLPKEEL